MIVVTRVVGIWERLEASPRREREIGEANFDLGDEEDVDLEKNNQRGRRVTMTGIGERERGCALRTYALDVLDLDSSLPYVDQHKN